MADETKDVVEACSMPGCDKPFLHGGACRGRIVGEDEATGVPAVPQTGDEVGTSSSDARGRDRRGRARASSVEAGPPEESTRCGTCNASEREPCAYPTENAKRLTGLMHAETVRADLAAEAAARYREALEKIKNEWEWANHHDHAEDIGEKMAAIATEALTDGENDDG